MTVGQSARTALLRARARYGGRDRMAEYAALLTAARDEGYEIVPLRELHERLQAGTLTDRRVLALRHDVDISDVAGNEGFWSIERSLGVRSTFYFRLSTVEAHRRLIPALLGAGFEVGYHFEEGAAIAKRLGLAHRSMILERRDEVEGLFERNCRTFRDRWSRDLASVASHGDWVNRRLGFANHELVSAALLASCGIRFEAYDHVLMNASDVYVSDVARPPERWANGYGLADAVGEGRSPIYLLAHERNWHVARRANAIADASRIADGLRYRIARWSARRGANARGE